MQLSILLVLFSALAAYSSPMPEQPSPSDTTPEEPFESPLPLPGDAPSPYTGIPSDLAFDLANGIPQLNLTQEELDAIPKIDSGNLAELDIPNPGMPDPEYGIYGPNAGTTCDTTYASPTFSEIQGVLNILYSKGTKKYCVQSNTHASRCTRLYSYKGASVSLCGNVDAILCRRVWLDLTKIRDQCKWKDGIHGWKAGGRYKYNWDLVSVLH
ncbi:hypothetical protein EDC01DRAFT_757088 [Geopyxis carbonaria]|nr:hypothetical protein EDC01DRAFT_757088 [Geopyxis carbonaria]